LEKHPQVHLVHVPTIQMGDKEPKYHTKHAQKSSLFSFRDDSKNIMKLIQSICPHFQKASIDEVYIDVTDQVRDMMEKDG
jgi:nucleotidyltransferase/DNA polymerase involved in DNA repair